MIRPVLELLLPAVVKDYFRDIQRRLSILETLVDTLIDSPTYVASPDAGFNGQLVRKQIFQELLKLCEFTAIVETGTWIGNTTGYLAETSQLPVYSSEINPRFYAIAQKRLAGMASVYLHQSDSYGFLQHLSTSVGSQQCLFFYLDSHWYDDLPLRQEIDYIAHHWQEFVIMVDDFQVPGDLAYGYDRYGKHVLNLPYIQDLLTTHQLVPFFPTTPARDESGSQRGCVVLTRRGLLCDRLASLPLLAPITT